MLSYKGEQVSNTKWPPCNMYKLCINSKTTPSVLLFYLILLSWVDEHLEWSLLAFRGIKKLYLLPSAVKNVI